MTILMIFETAAILKWMFIVTNRLASWFGSGYFYKKSIQQKKWRYFFLAICISVIMFLALFFTLKGQTHAAIKNADPEDIDYVAEHLPEAAMNNRFLSLPYATSQLRKGRWAFNVQPGFSQVKVDFINLQGPMLSASGGYAFRERWTIRVVGFYDQLRFSGSRGSDLLNPLFHESIPLDLPENAEFSAPRGTFVHWGFGPALDWAFSSSNDGRRSWIITVGSLWDRLDLKEYRFDYVLTSGVSAGQSGVLDHSARYDYVTSFFSLQYTQSLGSKFSLSPRLVAGLPLPKRAWIGRITGPGFDRSGDTKSAGHGTHMGDGFGGLGLSILHQPSGLSFDVGTTLYQALFEGKIHKGIDRDVVFTLTWNYPHRRN